MFFKRTKGFTIIEVLVVCAIIGLLSAVVIFSVSEARAKARDKVRLNDIEQLYVAMRLYVEQYGSKIVCRDGITLDGENSQVGSDCDDGDKIITFLESAMGAIPHDPRGPNDQDYYYYFDVSHTCGSVNKAIIFAVNMESTSTNAPSVCPQDLASYANNGGGFGKTKSFDPSTPYVKELIFLK